MNKKGISLVALVITIIVLIILTAAVVITGLKTPANAEQAVRNYSTTVVQDAVTIYVMNNMFTKMSDYNVSATSQNTLTVQAILSTAQKVDINGTATDVTLYNFTNDTWGTNAEKALGLNLTNEELNKLYKVSTTGAVTAR